MCDKCTYYGDCPYNVMECEEDHPHHKCKHRATASDYATLAAAARRLVAMNKELRALVFTVLKRGKIGWASDHILDDADEALAEVEALLSSETPARTHEDGAG